MSEDKKFIHYTVMKNEVVDSLNCYDSDKIFVEDAGDNIGPQP